MAKKIILSGFGLFWPNVGPQNFFPWVLPLLDVINFYKLPLYAISRKTNEPNLKKWQKNPSFGVDFGPFDPNLGPK